MIMQELCAQSFKYQINAEGSDSFLEEMQSYSLHNFLEIKTTCDCLLDDYKTIFKII